MFSLFKKLAWFFKEHKKKYILALSALAVVNVVEIIPPRLVGIAIDDIQTGVMTGSLLTRYIVIFLMTMVASYAFGFIWRYQLFGGGFLLEKSVRYKIMNHLLKMKPEFYQKFRTGDLMARSTNDLGAVETTAGYGILTLFDATIFMGIILIVMFLTVHPWLTLAAVAPLPIHAFLMSKLGNIYDKKYDVAQDAFSQMNDRVLESITGMRVVRAYVQEKEEIARFATMTEDVFEKNKVVEVMDSFWGPGTRIIVGLAHFIAISFGGYLILEGRMTLGDLVSFNVFLGMLTWPMWAISELINVVHRGKTSYERIEEILESPIDVMDIKEPVKMEHPHEIKFADFTFKYPSSATTVLSKIDLLIKRGQSIGIVGKTGSGKSTLIRQLLRQFPVEDSRLLVNGTPIEKLASGEVLSWIGYVPQEHVLFSKSVRENILFGLEEEKDENFLNEVIELAALTDDLEFFSDGLDTIVGEKGVALSGGQKQRISIARAIAINPEILILDDSLSAVDAKTEAKIIENIKKNRDGKTTIITAHRMSAVNHADQIIVMEDGKISQIGTHEMLMTEGGWYKEQYEHQNLHLGGVNHE